MWFDNPLPYAASGRRGNLPSTAAIYREWSDVFGTRTKYECFACGWDSSGFNLDRAHILARCEGGADDVSNLHLLCGRCHEASEYLNVSYWHWLVRARKSSGLDVSQSLESLAETRTRKLEEFARLAREAA